MNTKNLVLMAMLVGVGTALYLVIPGYGNGMKPDFMLTMMFIGILLFPTFKESFLIIILTALLSGIFSSFPAGLIPNIIEKIVTGFLFLAIVFLLKHLSQKLVTGTILVGIFTLISGVVFLSAALVIVGLPGGASFGALFVAVVIPAIVMNALLFAVIYPIIVKLVRRLKFNTSVSHA